MSKRGACRARARPPHRARRDVARRARRRVASVPRRTRRASGDERKTLPATETRRRTRAPRRRRRASVDAGTTTTTSRCSSRRRRRASSRDAANAVVRRPRRAASRRGFFFSPPRGGDCFFSRDGASPRGDVPSRARRRPRCRRRRARPRRPQRAFASRDDALGPPRRRERALPIARAFRVFSVVVRTDDGWTPNHLDAKKLSNLSTNPKP